jgi:hypothetical protein
MQRCSRDATRTKAGVFVAPAVGETLQTLLHRVVARTRPTMGGDVGMLVIRFSGLSG